MIQKVMAALAAALVLAACSQKDPANEAIEAAANALNAVYEDAQKYVPERYAEVKKELDTARKAFGEERYADAIAAVKDVPAHAECSARKPRQRRRSTLLRCPPTGRASRKACPTFHRHRLEAR